MDHAGRYCLGWKGALGLPARLPGGKTTTVEIHTFRKMRQNKEKWGDTLLMSLHMIF